MKNGMTDGDGKSARLTTVRAFQSQVFIFVHIYLLSVYEF